MLNHISIGVRDVAKAKRFYDAALAPSRKSVDQFYAAALKTGGRDNGKPGLRADYGPTYYAAFIVDPEGYRIEAYCGKAEG